MACLRQETHCSNKSYLTGFMMINRLMELKALLEQSEHGGCILFRVADLPINDTSRID